MPRALARNRRAAEGVGRSLVGAARGRLATAHATLQGMARLCEEISPQRTLRRGFSVTRTESGALLRQPAQVRAGERITTETSGGLVASRVEER